jgi:hypothetical protein
MSTEELITKVTQVFTQADGSEVKIVAQAFTGRGLAQSTGMVIHRRESPSHPWKLCNDDFQKPHPDWRTMSVDDYVDHGRSELLQAVPIGKLLKLLSAIGKPMRYIDQH